jgi:hypothetical protein
MTNGKTLTGKRAGALLAMMLLLVGTVAEAQKPKKGKGAKRKDADKTEQPAEASEEGGEGGGAEGAPSEDEKPADPIESGRQTALLAVMTLKVINPTAARVELERKAAEIGGFPMLITDELLTLKVPPGKLSEILQFAAEQGLVIEKTLERQDLTEQIAQLEGRLKSKLEILKRLRGFFDDSNVSATLRIEQTMTDLVAEIEEVKGQLRVARERAKFAVVDIAFQFKKRDRIIYVHSPFDWLNSVKLDRFLEEF